MFECFKGDKSNKLNFREISFLTYAALIRGAIAFGLVENLDPHTFEKKDVIVSTTFVLVVTSTFIFGGFTPLVQKLLLPSKKSTESFKVETSPNVTQDDLDANSKNKYEFQFDDQS